MFPFEETEDQMQAIEDTKSGHGEHKDHGPPDLRGRGLRKDGDRHPGSI